MSDDLTQQAGGAGQQQAAGAGDQGQSQQSSQQSQDGGQGQQGQGQGQQAAAGGVIGLTKEQLQELVQGATAGVAQQFQQQGQQQGQMSQEEFEKAFQFYKPSPALLEKFGGQEALPLLMELRDGLVRQALTMAAHYHQMQLREFEGRINPQLSAAQEVHMARMRDKFMEEYPDLKNCEPLLVEIRDSLLASGVRFKTQKEAFDAVATKARSILKSLAPQGQQQQGAAGGQQRGSTNNMSTVSSGGQGGVGAGSGSGGGKKPSWAID